MENKVLKPKIRFKGFTDTWEQRKLEGIYKFQYGEFNNNPSNGGIYPVYGANGIIGGYTNYNAENSVIIGHMGEYAGSVLWGNGKHFVTYNGTISKPRGENVVSKFGYYMLYQKDINKICGGSGLPFLSYEQLNKIEVCYPKDIKEQKSIANYLTNIDNLITLHQSKYDKLVNVKKALLEKMFPKDGKNVPEIRFKGFTDTWEQRKLGEIANVYDGTHQTPNYKNEGIMFLSVENIKNLQSEKYISKKDFYRDFKIYPEKNDILMTRIGDIGTTNIVRDDIPKAYYVSLALLKPQKINCEYLNIAIQSEYVQKGLMQRSLLTAIPMKINKEQIGQVDVLYPINNVEQEKIGTIFKAIDNLITLHQHKLEKLKNMKKSLLNKMFI